MNTKTRKLIIGIALELGFLALIIAIDLISKSLFQLLLENKSGVAAWEGVLEFVYITNDGASFGAFAGAKWLLIGAPIVVGVAILACLYINPTTDRLYRYSLLTILGGALGNLYDRIALEYVRDFIDYKFLDTWFGIDFAIGNIADLFCLIGVLMLIIYMIFGYKDGDVKRIFTPMYKQIFAEAKNA